MQQQNSVMSKVSYDSSNLRNCSKSLNSALQCFDNAINAANGLDVPDFAYQGWLNNLPGLLENYKVQCKEDQDWADNSMSKLDEELNSAEKGISSIDVQTGLVKELTVN